MKQGADGHPVAEICRRAGISEATFYKGRAKYGGTDASSANKLKALEDAKLKRLLAECRRR